MNSRYMRSKIQKWEANGGDVSRLWETARESQNSTAQNEALPTPGAAYQGTTLERILPTPHVLRVDLDYAL